jgi:hypothetical protein
MFRESKVFCPTLSKKTQKLKLFFGDTVKPLAKSDTHKAELHTPVHL